VKSYGFVGSKGSAEVFLAEILSQNAVWIQSTEVAALFRIRLHKKAVQHANEYKRLSADHSARPKRSVACIKSLNDVQFVAAQLKEGA
jgi:hypothetical protein